MTQKTSILDIIKKQFRSDLLVTDPETCGQFAKDWTKAFEPKASGVLFPKSTEEVSQIIKLCRTHKASLVPSGGRTGYAGGAVATQGELVLSLSKMNKIGPIDLSGHTLNVEAGAVTEAVHEHCKTHGLTWPIDIASKGSSCVGGNLSTNAGGIKVIRYGHTRHWVLGLTAVLGTGEIVRLNGALEKNNTGYDLKDLLIGSEGTLGVITEATLKLARLPKSRQVALFSVDSIPACLKLLSTLRIAGVPLSGFEFFTQKCLELVCKVRNLRKPFSDTLANSTYVLVEIDEPHTIPELDTIFEKIFSESLVLDGVLSQNEKEAAQLWIYREGISESIASTGIPHKNDISLSLQNLSPFVDDLEKLLTSNYPTSELYIFGHLGDGNIHINVMKPDQISKENFLDWAKKFNQDLFQLLSQYHGSISAEHGIGLVKKDYLHFGFTAIEIEMMKKIKNIFDPDHILNPGKIFDL